MNLAIQIRLETNFNTKKILIWKMIKVLKFYSLIQEVLEILILFYGETWLNKIHFVFYRMNSY